MKRPEILSPAGNFEKMKAAILYGADAVYLGLPKFSARAEAINFTQAQLDEFEKGSHLFSRAAAVFVRAGDTRPYKRCM